MRVFIWHWHCLLALWAGILRFSEGFFGRRLASKFAPFAYERAQHYDDARWAAAHYLPVVVFSRHLLIKRETRVVAGRGGERLMFG